MSWKQRRSEYRPLGSYWRSDEKAPPPPSRARAVELQMKARLMCEAWSDTPTYALTAQVFAMHHLTVREMTVLRKAIIDIRIQENLRGNGPANQVRMAG